jgi:predicted GIY-YIG superfamily endonuclease
LKYHVYQIEIEGVVRYIGRTNDLHRRELEHKRGLKTGFNKELYNHIRLEFGEEYDGLELKLVRSFKKKVDSKRYETYLILENYFSGWTLLQSIPPLL